MFEASGEALPMIGGLVSGGLLLEYPARRDVPEQKQDRYAMRVQDDRQRDIEQDRKKNGARKQNKAGRRPADRRLPSAITDRSRMPQLAQTAALPKPHPRSQTVKRSGFPDCRPSASTTTTAPDRDRTRSASGSISGRTRLDHVEKKNDCKRRANWKVLPPNLKLTMEK